MYNNKKSVIYLLLSCSIFFASCSGEKTDNAQIESDISPVSSKINGTITRVFIEDNQVVKEGDTILSLDDANYIIAVQQAEIAVAIAKKSVQLSRSNSGTVASTINSAAANSSAVEANMASAAAGVQAARVAVEVSSKNYQRFKNLLEEKSATQQQFDGAKAEKEGAEAQLKIAQAQVSSLNKQIDASKYQVATTQTTLATSYNGISLAELNVKQAEANLDAAKLQLSYCYITAPTSGIISKKNIQKGQVIAVGQPLLAITDNKKAWVVANFKETQVEGMKVGQEVAIKIDAYDDDFKGKVVSISQATGAKFSLLPADNATGNFVKVTQRIPVKIEFTELDKNTLPLRTGMSVNVKVKTK